MNARVVVVTGASGGIGRAVARAFGSRGAAVALLARGEQGLAGAAREVRDAGGPPLVVPLDVADQAQVFAAADRVEAELGAIDVWVNVAFTSVFSPFDKIHPDEYRRVTEVSYLGYVYGTMAALQNDETPGPGHHRAGRLRAGLPRHPVADRVLRRETRDPGFPRGAALRTAAREERCARHHGADARA